MSRLIFEGAARNLTSASERKKFGPHYEVCGLRGTEELSGLSITHEYEPGWKPVFRFEVGKTYRIEVEPAPAPTSSDDSSMPSHGLPWKTSPDFAYLSKCRVPRDRTETSTPAVTSVWTDGLSLNDDSGGHYLVADRWYRVTISPRFDPDLEPRRKPRP